MKQSFILLSAIVLLFSSCEKVINVDLNKAAPQFVIEAEVFEGSHPFKVHVAKTTDFYGRQPQETINDAVITLKDETGPEITVPSTGNGWYELPSFTAAAGHTYHLNVKSQGKEFTAQTTMPEAVNLDSVGYEYKEDNGFEDAGYQVVAYFNDPAGAKNFYRLLVTVNDTLQNKAGDLYIDNDKYNNGRLVKETFFDQFNQGDKVQIELRGMDEQVYDFYSSLNSVLNNQDGPAPANPNSNIQGGALGFFGAFTSSKKMITLP